MNRQLAGIHRWRPTSMVLQLAAVLVVTGACLGTFLLTLQLISDRAHRTKSLAEAQSSTALLIEDSAQVLRVLAAARPVHVTLAELPANAPLVMPLAQASEISVTISASTQRIDTLNEIMPGRETDELVDSIALSQASLASYLAEPDAGHFRDLQANVQTLRNQSAGLLPIISGELIRQEAGILRITQWTQNSAIALSTAAVVTVMGTIWFFGKRLERTLATMTREKSALIETTAGMHRRNEQFKALYQVVTEVSETLSLDYVVQTTIREARNLVRADVAVLRLLQDQRLVVAGTAQDVDADMETLSDVHLGIGLVGRAAKRGKIIRINEDAEVQMDQSEFILGVQSGVVVPLIVGARVVGTLACWSRQPFLFTSDDEQVLEMMASQVATAVVAASTHEASEHEASHDALTGVPNRRQLNRDIREHFLPALAQGRAVSFTMIDIDHFKRFNDEFGHKVGDVTLQKVASVLQHTVREGDFVYRYGGEEFTIVFVDTEASEALPLMERVRTAISRAPLTGGEGEPVGPVTISAGIASGPALGLDCELILKRADDALYQSKWSGRNRITLYDPSLNELPALEPAA